MPILLWRWVSKSSTGRFPETRLLFLVSGWVTGLIFSFLSSRYSLTCIRQPLLGPVRSLLSWAGGHLIKYLYKTTTNKICSFLAGV